MSIAALAPVSRRIRRWPPDTIAKTVRATALPIEAIAVRSKNTARTAAASAGEQQRPRCAPAQRFFAMTGGHWPLVRHVSTEAGGGIETGVRGAGGGEERGDAHEPVPGSAEHRLGGHGERGATRFDDLVDREGAEHAEGDEDVDGRGDAQREVHGRGTAGDQGRSRSLAVKVMTPKPRNAKNVRATLDTMSLIGG